MMDEKEAKGQAGKLVFKYRAGARPTLKCKEEKITMSENNNESLDNWDAFKGHWLKPDLVKVVPVVIVVNNVRADTIQDGDPQVVLSVKYMLKDFDFSLNKTNQKFLEKNGISSPKLLQGKKLTLVKDKVYNPSTKSRVDSLFIDKVE